MHSYIPGGSLMASHANVCSPASISPEKIRFTSVPRRFTIVTSTAPLSGDEKVIVVDWERGLGYALIEFWAGGVAATSLGFIIWERGRAHTPLLIVAANRNSPQIAKA